MKIYILPVSGGKFTIQLGQLMALSAATIENKTPFVPNVVLASSGGNVAAYIAHASSWECDKMRATSSYLESEAFITNWVDMLPGFIFAPFSKTIFRPGYGFKSFFRRCFTGSEAVRSGAEIWTGVYEKCNCQHRVFCNKSKQDNTILNASNAVVGNLYLGDRTNPFYTGGNVEIVADVVLASASIPLVAFPVTICGKEYLDGGCTYASPLSVFSEEIKREISKWETPFEGMYFCGSPLLVHDDSFCFNFLGEIGSVLSARLFSDIRAFVGIMTFLGADENPESVHEKVSSENLRDIINAASNNGRNHYGIILFPSNLDFEINISCINRGDVSMNATMAMSDVNAAVWTYPMV